ncbi:MAG: Peptidyl-prolyl cis-trans isomerase [Candidatus Gottesmanbacteria bacterium GW2011_GWC2_39_8]|uniref:Peptidyl-prolyl cis-trans isomerase n=1 Tax=Candidatus Gottesmanbacteria bacterium GW2011_GWC2_39_8 TaxID=1618450 RepID=A0A0G0PZ45_9BACT|nr:MAG: Peptidyl-prolyl cis-trans isomerase [Candidatus Gottesmanbacteria bacterium GW2011_GWC2_39_8]
MKNNVFVIFVFLLGLIIAFILTSRNKQGVKESFQDTGLNNKSLQDNIKPTPKMTIDPNKKYSAVISTTDGDITVELDTKNTPVTANNFVTLARSNFYDNTVFHRVIKDFMIQGGDPGGDGTGGPGYKFDDEKIVGDYTRGTVAMANSGPNTNGSQFFIMHKDTDLPKNYVIFGHVTHGMEIVDKIAESEVTPNSMGEDSKPVTPVKIVKIAVLEE